MLSPEAYDKIKDYFWVKEPSKNPFESKATNQKLLSRATTRGWKFSIVKPEERGNYTWRRITYADAIKRQEECEDKIEEKEQKKINRRNEYLIFDRECADRSRNHNISTGRKSP